MGKKKAKAEETTESSEEEEVNPEATEEEPTQTPEAGGESEQVDETEIDGMFEDYEGRGGGRKATIKKADFERLVSRAKAILEERQREQTMSMETVNKVLGTNISNSNGFAYALKEGIDLVDEDGEVAKDGTNIISTEDILIQYNVYIGTYGGRKDKKTGIKAPQGLVFKEGFQGAPSKRETA